MMDFSTNPCIGMHLKSSHNQALFTRKVIIVHFYLKEPTSVLTNEIKSGWANCVFEGSWEALWRRWWRSDVVILFRCRNTNVFHGLHLCRLWFTWFQHVVFELLALITATSPDSPKIHAVFKIVEGKLNNLPTGEYKSSMLSANVIVNFKIQIWFFPCEKCQNEATSLRRNAPNIA